MSDRSHSSPPVDRGNAEKPSLFVRNIHPRSKVDDIYEAFGVCLCWRRPPLMTSSYAFLSATSRVKLHCWSFLITQSLAFSIHVSRKFPHLQMPK